MSIINSCVVAHQFAIGIDRDGIVVVPVMVWSMYIRMYVCMYMVTLQVVVTRTLHNYVFLTLVMLHTYACVPLSNRITLCTVQLVNNTNTALFNWLITLVLHCSIG